MEVDAFKSTLQPDGPSMEDAAAMSDFAAFEGVSGTIESQPLVGGKSSGGGNSGVGGAAGNNNNSNNSSNMAAAEGC